MYQPIPVGGCAPVLERRHMIKPRPTTSNKRPVALLSGHVGPEDVPNSSYVVSLGRGDISLLFSLDYHAPCLFGFAISARNCLTGGANIKNEIFSNISISRPHDKSPRASPCPCVLPHIGGYGPRLMTLHVLKSNPATSNKRPIALVSGSGTPETSPI